MYDSIFGTNISEAFSSAGLEYTDQLTPEVARHQGYVRGATEHNEYVLKYIKTNFKRPSKQMQELVTKLEELGTDINDN